ncbi:protein PLASTID REDOX INSENSITIVE 2, chloroplastic [Ricinus communis]|uniref:protein PLASTID REDOX INSENSITIVE 2, chloroplastic n=1 Tax=Ricinus communis TaxID=3988 RepID=UPI00201AE15B|nr:protein PLASTID REDOX INSENSITIVE 2, chloroplastic [Ricinus communis]
MALLYSLPLLLSPAKLSISSTLILRAPSLSFSILRAKPISSNTVGATPSFQNYVYSDPIPEFAQSETEKFRAEILKKLSKDKQTFGGDLDKVVDVCSEIFSDFLHKEYGGPGTLLVEPFTDMLIALKEKNLPGAPLAARESLLWAQNYVDQDWEAWNSNLPK